MPFSEKMTPTERNTTLGLASIYGLRMLGMFLMLPIFAVYAEKLEGGSNHTLVGLALGAYGLTQVVMQLPFGLASDKYGRKKMIYIGLLFFVLGSVIAALATDIYTVIIGRAIQGAGAISAVVMALVADLTREEHRTKAMAMIGATIGLTFAFSLVGGPILNRLIGVSGIFWLTAMLSLIAMAVVRFWVPDPLHSHFHSETETAPEKIKDMLKNTQLLRLNFGTFALHAAQMAMFVVVPFALKETSGMGVNQHWQVYFPVLSASFFIMLPAIIIGEKHNQLKSIFISAVLLMLLAQVMFAFSIHHFWGIVVSLLAYFVAFNILEASLPSLMSKMAPAAAKGTAIGIHNTAQSLGIFIGATMGGFLSHQFGFSAVFIFCAGLMFAWLLLTFSMSPPPSVKTKMYHLPTQNEAEVQRITQEINALESVYEAVGIAQENVMIVKIVQQKQADKLELAEQTILQILNRQIK